MNIIKTILGRKSADLLVSNKEIKLVQCSFAYVRPMAHKMAEIFYARLFHLDPDLSTLFEGSLESKSERFMGIMTTIVEGLDDADQLDAFVCDLRKQYDGNMKLDDYGTFGAALLSALEESLGNQWNEKLRSAWVCTYTGIAACVIANTPKAA